MKCLALGALFAVMQTSSPVPRKTANDAVKENQKLQTQARHGKTASPEPQAPDNPAKAEIPKQDSANHLAQNEGKVVSVRVPPINVNKDWADYLYILANLLLTVATFVIVIYAVVQASGAKASAEAALLNARAIINSERPWPFIKIETKGADCDLHGVVEHLGFSVSFRNCGKTPAEIVSFDQHPDCRKDTDDLPSPPKYSLEGRVMLHTRMIPPNETWRDSGESHFYVESFLLQDQ